MSIYTSHDTLGYRLLSTPRKLRCFCLPGAFEPPRTEAAEKVLTERIGDLLGIEQLSSRIQQLGYKQWLFAFFHGQTRRHRAATFENGQPGSVTYTPRQAALIVVDARNGLFYVSASKVEQIEWLLPALNGTLFPNRAEGMPFSGVQFDLNVLALLRQNDRMPQVNNSPWQTLMLKFVTWQEAGIDAPISKTAWSVDGFEALELQAFTWPTHLLSAGLTFKPVGARTAFSVSFEHHQNLLRASLAPQTLEGVAALVTLFTQSTLMTATV